MWEGVCDSPFFWIIFDQSLRSCPVFTGRTKGETGKMTGEAGHTTGKTGQRTGKTGQSTGEAEMALIQPSVDVPFLHKRLRIRAEPGLSENFSGYRRVGYTNIFFDLLLQEEHLFSLR